MVFVISNTKQKLMPTTEYRTRKLLKSGKAIIYKYRPFTIMLIKRQQGDIQDIQYKCDTGYKFIGVFNSAAMNEAVAAFRRYEESSLSYTGVDKHYGEKVGLWDISVKHEELESMT